MRSALAACTMTVLLCASARTADSPAQILFNRLRENVRGDLLRAPRYTCVQTITRTQHRPQYGGRPAGCPALIAVRAELRSPGLLLWHDRLRLDVAVGEQAEMFSWAGARRFESNSLDDLALSGSTGSGDFSAFLGSVFGTAAEGFRYNGEQETPFGRLAAYSFTVPLAKSHYSYRTNNGVSRIIPYSGTFYAAQANAELKRLVVEATQFPGGEVCRVVDTMDYNRVKIGSGEFLLPEVSKMVVLYQNGEETQNETRYSGCHEFTGESTIRFDDPEEPNSPANVAKAALRALPPKTHIRVKIDPPVNTETAAAGDPITGVVEREVKEKGQVVVRTTDRLHGRLLRLEQAMLPEPRWTVAIRFDSIERDGVEQPVALKPVDDGDRSPQPIRMRGRRMQSAPVTARPERPAGAGVFLFGEAGRLVLDAKFHSEWETK
ncbi:MAG: hypothetical protein ABUS51_00345 [Acidobacteriota bacterium]